MRCPYCKTENRDDREKCYHCGKDLSMLRLIANRAKNHYNHALEHAERGRLNEAVGELNNALQLRSDFPEARLLLGTVYAQLKQYTEARQQWEKLLESNKSSERAHKYLADLPEAKRVLPAARRVRAVLAASAGAVLVVVAISAALLWPSRQEQLLSDAWTAFNQNDYAKSRDILARAERPFSDADIEQSATRLDQSIESLLSARLSLVQDLLAAENFDSAKAEIEDLRAWSLPVEFAHSLDDKQNMLGELAERQLLQLAGREFNAQNYRRLTRAAEEYAELFPDSPVEEELLDQFRQKGEFELAGLLERAEGMMGEIEQRSEFQGTLVQARKLSEVLGRGESRIQNLESEAERRRAEQQLALADELYGERRFQQALSVLQLVEARHLDERLMRWEQQLRTDITRAHTRRQLADARALLRQGDFISAADLRARIEAPASLQDEVADFDQALEQQRERAAVEAFYALMERGDRLESAQVDPAEARDTLQRVELASGNLPPALGALGHDDIVFFRAIAHRVLGDEDAFRAAAAELRDRFPESPYTLSLERIEAREIEPAVP